MYRAYGHIYILLSFCDIVDELIPQIKWRSIILP
jgi:hypothetical protein